jgi:glycosyltransferase involved in cell wall biosynthesis
MQSNKLAIIVSHPIQYYSPLFRELAKEIDLVVFYGYKPDNKAVGTPGFGIEFEWDIDLLSGYNYHFFNNISKSKELGTFKGVKVSKKELEIEFQKHKITHCVIFGWLYLYYWQAYFYCLKQNIPVAARGDSTLPEKENKIKTALKKIFYPYFIKKYNTIFYVGKRNLAYMKYFGASDKQLIFSPHAIDQNFWKPTNNSKKENSNTINILWVGKFTLKKRPFDMVKAFEILNKEFHPNIKLTMIGTGELFNEIENYIKTNNIKNIELLGFKNQTELIPYYENANLLIMSSKSSNETWGLVVNEAFSFGIPAIVSHQCGCKDDLIEEGKTGYTYEAGNVGELVSKIKQFINDRKNVNFTTNIKEKNKIYSYAENVKAFKKFIDKN